MPAGITAVGVLPSLQVAVSGRSVLLPRDLAAIRMCARASNGLPSPGPLHPWMAGDGLTRRELVGVRTTAN